MKRKLTSKQTSFRRPSVTRNDPNNILAHVKITQARQGTSPFRPLASDGHNKYNVVVNFQTNDAMRDVLKSTNERLSFRRSLARRTGERTGEPLRLYVVNQPSNRGKVLNDYKRMARRAINVITPILARTHGGIKHRPPLTDDKAPMQTVLMINHAADLLGPDAFYVPPLPTRPSMTPKRRKPRSP